MKKKKIISLLFLFVLLFAFTSCVNSREICADSLENIYKDIAEKINMDYDKIELSKDDMLDYYGIDAKIIDEFVAVQDACGYKDEIVMIKAVDTASAQEIYSALTEHIEYQKNSMRNYDAKQYDILTKSKADIKGLWVSMFISSSQDEMLEIYNSYFS